MKKIASCMALFVGAMGIAADAAAENRGLSPIIEDMNTENRHELWF